MAINKKLIHFNTFENFNSKKLSANVENTQYTLGVDGEVQTGSPDILYQSICWIKDTKQQWTHGQLYDGGSTEATTLAYAEYTGTNTAVEVTTIDGYFPTTLVEGAAVAVKIEGSLTLIKTLNVNGTGVKNVYYKGNSLVSGSINRYNTYLFIFDGSYYRIIGVDTDTHYTAKNVITSNSTSTSNATATNGNVHLNVVENSTVRSSHKITGTGGTTVTSDASGHITIDTPLKTINGESIVGSGDLIIESGAKVYNFDLDAAIEAGAVTQDVYDAIIAADVVKYDGLLLNNSVDGGTILLHAASATISDTGDVREIAPGVLSFTIGADLSFTYDYVFASIPTKTSQLTNDSNFISSDNLKTINGESIEGSGDIVIGGGSPDANVSAVDTSETLDDVDGNTYVKYVAQTLTDEQKAQVRTNINALSQNSIKTINGESIIGSGNIVIGGGGVIQITDVNAILSNIEPEKVYVCVMGLQSLTIQSFSDNGSKHQEYTIVFYGGTYSNITLILPEGVLWANGEIPEVENEVYYELSITRTIHGASPTTYYKAVLVPFKPV